MKGLFMAVLFVFLAGGSAMGGDMSVDHSKMVHKKKGHGDKELTLRKVDKKDFGKKVYCVVMDNKFKVDKRTKVMTYKGKNYYFCCAGCPDKFKKNPEKYVVVDSSKSYVRIRKSKKAEMGKKFICPVMGTANKVKKNTVAAEYKGETYFFCCSECIGKFTKDPAKYTIRKHSKMHKNFDTPKKKAGKRDSDKNLKKKNLD